MQSLSNIKGLILVYSIDSSTILEQLGSAADAEMYSMMEKLF